MACCIDVVSISRLHGDSDPDPDWLRLYKSILDSIPDPDHLFHMDCDPDSNPDSGPGARVNAPMGILIHIGCVCTETNWIQIQIDSDHLSLDCDPDSNPGSGPGARVELMCLDC